MTQSIKTQRLTVRPIVPEDWRSIQAIWADFNASPYSQYDTPHSTDSEDVRTRIAKWASANEGTEHLFFAVCLGEAVIGYIACNIRERSYELGYCFHSAYHGRGYAAESHRAVFALLRQIGIRRLTAGTALRNVPSVALLHTLGFRQIAAEQVSFYRDAQGRRIFFDGGVFELLLQAGSP